MIEATAARRILLVDDDDTFRNVLGSELSRRGHEVSAAATGKEALDFVSRTAHDVVLLDLRLPDMDGLEVLKRISESSSPAGVIVLTGHGTIDTAIQAMRMGAYDYLEKPCPIAKVELAILKTGQHMALVERQRVLQDGYSPPDVSAGMIGASEEFLELRRLVARIARSDSTTLITGETGVGKEMVAKLLHSQSARADAPFVVVDCTVLDEEMLRSELFGHEQGAFTGASRRKHGLFEVADGGTLLLDEIGAMPMPAQAKLLHVLEDRIFFRVGGTKPIPLLARVISATNTDIEKAIIDGQFRKDLFYRINVVMLEVPPLCERHADVIPLTKHFMTLYNHKFGKDFSSIAPETEHILEQYSWPGSVRELKNSIERIILLEDGNTILPEHLPFSIEVNDIKGKKGSFDFEGARELYHKRARMMIDNALNQTDNNIQKAAQLLNLPVHKFRYQIKKLGMKISR